MKSFEDKQANSWRSRDEDWTIWIGVCCGIHGHWTTPKRTSCLSIKFFFLLHLAPLLFFLPSSVLFSTAWSSPGPRAHTALSAWMQLIIQREKFVPVEKLSLLTWLVNANKKRRSEDTTCCGSLSDMSLIRMQQWELLWMQAGEGRKSRMEKIKEKGGKKTSFTSSSIITPNEE